MVLHCEIVMIYFYGATDRAPITFDFEEKEDFPH